MSDALRQAIVETARRMNALGINQGMSGNVSARSESGFLITPSGMDYDAMTAGDVVAMSAAGEAEAGRPSSEWRFHHDIYQSRPDANAVVHTHSAHATTLACLGRGIPAFHYMIAIAGGRDVRCAPYATFGTQELSDHAVAALEGRKACLLANHGLIALGDDLTDALRVAEEVEVLAGQYWRALQIGEPAILSETEMDDVIEKFKGYGR